jgi:hypothetical protein
MTLDFKPLKTIRMLFSMKKLLSVSSPKVLLLCGLGLIMTLGSFWYHQLGQSQLDRMNVLNQGTNTCWGRISQTFTAMMIKDIKSPYLGRGFMGLSDECLKETIKGINPFKQAVGKGHETLNKLISEVHWFHEIVTKIHSPMLSGEETSVPLNPLSDRFSKMENLKVTLMDEIDAANATTREVQANVEVIMGLGLLLFVLGLSILSLQEFNRIQLRREIDKEALNLLAAGHANVGAIVDSLVDRALLTQGMLVTAQVFRDYHGELLERSSAKFLNPKKKEQSKSEEIAVIGPEKEEFNIPAPKTSLKEVLVSLQNVHTSEVIHISDVRDVLLAVEYETCEQMLSSALNKMSSIRKNNKKIMISNQIHSDRSIVSLFLAENTFSASDLEYADTSKSISVDRTDMNMTILKEMVAETGSGFFIENKTDKSGSISGVSIRLTLKRAPKERSQLVSVVKGKKKDLTREMMS